MARRRRPAHRSRARCLITTRALEHGQLITGNSRLDEKCFACRIDPMNGKHVFGQIDTHGNNGHGASPPVVVMAFAGALQLRRELGTQLLQLPLERLDLALALLVKRLRGCVGPGARSPTLPVGDRAAIVALVPEQIDLLVKNVSCITLSEVARRAGRRNRRAARTPGSRMGVKWVGSSPNPSQSIDRKGFSAQK